MRDGSVRRSIQEQGGGAVVAAGERPSGRGITRDWGFGADVWPALRGAKAVRMDGADLQSQPAYPPASE